MTLDPSLFTSFLLLYHPYIHPSSFHEMIFTLVAHIFYRRLRAHTNISMLYAHAQVRPRLFYFRTGPTMALLSRAAKRSEIYD